MIVGATVRAPTCMLTDGLTKILMVGGPASAALLDRHHASGLIVSAEGVLVTTGWQGLRLAA